MMFQEVLFELLRKPSSGNSRKHWDGDQMASWIRVMHG
jgi:hypothetical protein